MCEEVASMKGDGQSAGAHAPPIGEWIQRLRLIPEERRRFHVDPGQAKLEFGIDMTLAQELIARGLPHMMSDGYPRFTATDLHYIGLRLGCATTYLGVLQMWASGLKASADGEWTAVEVRCAPKAPQKTAVEVLVSPGQRVRASIGANRIAASIRAVPVPRWPAVSPALEDLLVDVASMDFCWMPESLSGDVEFTRQTRLSDCENAALLVSMECARLGVGSRMAYGLLLSTPFSTPHTWVEIRVGDRWVPVDPLLIGLLAQYTTLDASAWPPIRSPGAVLLRLADRETPIVLADGRPLQASFLTRIL
jgi:Transglutaminase-like superfamily